MQNDAPPAGESHTTTNPLTDPSPKKRNSMLDASRLIAACAILMMHTFESAHRAEQGEFGRFGVPFFCVTTIYLLITSLRKKSDRPFVPYAQQRFIRLYLPFLGWAVLSSLGMLAKHVLVSGTPQQPLRVSDLLTGRSFQLWFLPFILIAGLVFFPICRFAARLNTGGQRIVAGLAIVLAFGFPFVPMPFTAAIRESSYDYFCGLSWQAISPLFFGLAIGLLFGTTPRPSWQAILGVTITILAMVHIQLRGRNPLIESVSGAAFVFFALAAWDGPIVAFLARYPFLVYGIYLSQGIVLETVQVVVGRARISPTVPVELAVVGVSLVICIGMSFALNRSRWTRWLLG